MPDNGSKYELAGVNLNIYSQTMQAIKPLLNKCKTPRVLEWQDGFAGLFRLNHKLGLLSRTYKDPVLVSAADGVGTKLKVAFAADKHDTVGIDLVAMNVNDVLCAGAEPLFFLDYIAMDHDNTDLVTKIVTGITVGCSIAECALIGGETSILPGFYSYGEYDLAGFCVGVVERSNIITGKSIKVTDKIIGISSSGLHSNGYSLVRKVIVDSKLCFDHRVPELGVTVADELLRPTIVYNNVFKCIRNYYKIKKIIHGIAHVTGGGLIDNVPRILPEGHSARILRGAWAIPPVFPWLQQIGSLDEFEMYRVFNMGIGMVLIVSEYYANTITDHLRYNIGVPSWIIGDVISGNREVVWQ